MEVPVGTYPIALCNVISSTERLDVVVLPRIVVLVVVGVLFEARRTDEATLTFFESIADLPVVPYWR